MTRATIVDGTDLATLGIGTSRVTGRGRDRQAEWPTEKVTGRIGHVFVASRPVIAPRTIGLALVAEAATRSALLAALDQAAYVLSPRVEHVFTFVDDEARQVTGRVTSLEMPAIGPDLVQTACEIAVGILCADPREYATTDTTVAGITTDTAVPQGADATEPVLTITGAGTFTVTYKDSAGSTVATLGITGAAAPVTIDMQTGVITDNAGDGSAFLDADSDFPFSLDPQDGDFLASAWPTLAVSAGSMTAVYRKAY